MRRNDPPAAWLNSLAMVGSLAFAAPLLVHAYAGTASRYLGDDYCAGYIFRDYGLVGGQIWHYKSWSAVPTTLFLMAATEPGGPRLAAMLPATALALWLMAAAWTIRRISALSGSVWGWLVCVWLAEVLMYATLQDAPNVAQSVYLRVPMLAYTCPLIVLTVYIGWLARAVDRNLATRGTLVGSAALACAFGAFGPVCAAFLTVALVLGWTLSRTFLGGPRRRSAERLLAAGCAGAIVALALVALAPGNATRQGYFPEPPGPLKVGMWSILYTVFMFCRPVVPFLRDAIVTAVPHVIGETPKWLPMALEMGTSPVPLAITMVVAAILTLSFDSPAAGRPHVRPACLWIPAVAFVLVCACMAPGAYGTSAPPPPRALIIPQYVITCLAACWGFALASSFLSPLREHVHSGRALTWLIAGTLFVIGPVAATPRIIATGTAMRQWAERWDDTDLQLRNAQAAGIRDATVPALDRLAGVGSISPDPQDWVNICAAHYYGLRSITGRPSS